MYYYLKTKILIFSSTVCIAAGYIRKSNFQNVNLIISIFEIIFKRKILTYSSAVLRFFNNYLLIFFFFKLISVSLPKACCVLVSPLVIHVIYYWKFMSCSLKYVIYRTRPYYEIIKNVYTSNCFVHF